MTQQKNLKAQVLEVSQDYLGPAAQRFFDIQISTHLGKECRQINNKDLVKLIDWIRLSFALLTDDGALADEYIRRLTFVAKGRGSEALGKEWFTK